MALKFKKGDKVRQVVHIFEGVVTDAAIIDADVQFKVDYVGADGESHTRHFTEDQIELAPVEAAPAVEAAPDAPAA